MIGKEKHGLFFLCRKEYAPGKGSSSAWDDSSLPTSWYVLLNDIFLPALRYALVWSSAFD